MTQNLPVLAQPVRFRDINLNTAASDKRSPIFTLAQGPPAFDFAAILGDISSAGTLPLARTRRNVTPQIRPTTQRLPTLDAWNATIQRQVTSNMSVEVAYIGNKGTHMFAGRRSVVRPQRGRGWPRDEPHHLRNADNLRAVRVYVPFTPQSNRRRLFLNGVPRQLPATDSAGRPLACCAVDWLLRQRREQQLRSVQVKVESVSRRGLQFLAHYTYWPFERLQLPTTTRWIRSSVRSGSVQPHQRVRDQHRVRTAVRQRQVAAR